MIGVATGLAGPGRGPGAAGDRGGRKLSGSTYPSGSDATRTPRCTCDSDVTGSALGPTAPTTAPSSTAAPRTTAVAPSWSTVTAYPSAVWIVTTRPPFGTEPTKETVPDAAARTRAPSAAAMSMPRC